MSFGVGVGAKNESCSGSSSWPASGHCLSLGFSPRLSPQQEEEEEMGHPSHLKQKEPPVVSLRGRARLIHESVVASLGVFHDYGENQKR